MKNNNINKIVQIVSYNIKDVPEDFNEFDIELSQLGMDSILFIRIILALEEEFNIEIPDDKLLPTAMGTIRKMADIVCIATR